MNTQPVAFLHANYEQSKKRNLENSSIYSSSKKDGILTNKFKQGGKRLLH
jgi:hypothetical protein